VELIGIHTERTATLYPSAAIEIELTERPRPILWDNAGLHGLIPVERIKNALAVRDALKKAGYDHVVQPLCFDWSAAIVLTSYAPSDKG